MVLWVRCAWGEEPTTSHPSAGRWFKFYNSQNPSGAGYKAFIIPKVSSCWNNRYLSLLLLLVCYKKFMYLFSFLYYTNLLIHIGAVSGVTRWPITNS